jgi:hypothetical protein
VIEEIVDAFHQGGCTRLARAYRGRQRLSRSVGKRSSKVSICLISRVDWSSAS